MNSNPLSTLIVVVAISFGVWYFLKKQQVPIPQLGYPQGAGPVPGGNLVDSLVDDLYDSMNGIGLFHPGALSEKKESFTELLNQNDNTIILVNSKFNAKYGHGQTLKQWVAGETMSIWGNAYGELQTAVIRRLTNLGLK